MKLAFWRKAAAATAPLGHTGIRLRIRTPHGPLVEADSDHLYWIAKYGGIIESRCEITCLPGCTEHGWYELFPGEGMGYAGSRDLVVEMMPVRLSG